MEQGKKDKKTNKSSNKANGDVKVPAVPIADPRFAKVQTDPRFKKFHQEKSKLKVDSRFEPIFKDPKFQVSQGTTPRLTFTLNYNCSNESIVREL